METSFCPASFPFAGVLNCSANSHESERFNFNILNSKNWEKDPVMMCAVSAATLLATCAAVYGISRWSTYFFKMHSSEVVETVASTMGKGGRVVAPSAMANLGAAIESTAVTSIAEELAVGRIVSAQVHYTEAGLILKNWTQVEEAMRMCGSGWLGKDAEFIGEAVVQDIMREHGYDAAKLLRWSQLQRQQNIGGFVESLLLKMRQGVDQRGIFNLSLSQYEGAGIFTNCSIHLSSISSGKNAYYLNIRSPALVGESRELLADILSAKPMMFDLRVIAEIEPPASAATFAFDFEAIRKRLMPLFPHLREKTGADIVQYFFYNPEIFYQYPLLAENGLLVTMQPNISREYRFVYEAGRKVRDLWSAEGAVLRGSRAFPWQTEELLPSSLKISIECSPWDEIYDVDRYPAMIRLAEQIKMALIG